MAEVGSAFVSLVPSMAGFGKKMEAGVSGEVDGAGKKMGLSFGKVFGAVAALGIGAKVGDFLRDSLTEAREAEVIGARTESVIKSMGLAGTVSAGQIGKLATAISNKTAVDDEAIQSGQNLLLTFGNVAKSAGQSNGVFAQTSGLMVDLSAAMGQDMKSSAVQLGKALNDPVKGVSALTRVGVSFTQGQKDQIAAMVESGNTMGAQKVILGELKKQFGGAAASMATPAEKAKVAFGNLKEQIGTALLPAIDKFAKLISETVVPAVSKFIEGIQKGTGFIDEHKIAATALTVTIGALVAVTKAHAAVLAVHAAGGLAAMIKNLPIVTTLTKAWAAVQWVLNAALSANPIGIVIAVVAALVAAFVVAYKKSETFRKIVDTAFGAIKTTITTVVNAVKNIIDKAWSAIQAIFKAFTGPDIVGRAWDKIKSLISAGMGAIKGLVSDGWAAIKAKISGALDAVKAAVSNGWDAVKTATVNAWDRIKSGVSDGIGKTLDLVKSIPGKVKSALGDFGSMLYDKGADLIQGLIDGIKAKLSAVGDAMGSVASKIGGFLPGSPVKEGPLRSWNNGGAGKRLVELLASGIDDGAPLVTHASNRLASRIASPTMAAASVSHENVSASASLADVVAEVRRQSTILERMPKDYQLGMRKGAH